MPLASLIAQIPNCMVISQFLAPVMEKLGAMTMISPLAFVSKNRSGCSAQKSANCWSVIGRAVSVAGRETSSIVNRMFVAYRICKTEASVPVVRSMLVEAKVMP